MTLTNAVVLIESERDALSTLARLLLSTNAAKSAWCTWVWPTSATTVLSLLTRPQRLLFRATSGCGQGWTPIHTQRAVR